MLNTTLYDPHIKFQGPTHSAKPCFCKMSLFAKSLFAASRQTWLITEILFFPILDFRKTCLFGTKFVFATRSFWQKVAVRSLKSLVAKKLSERVLFRQQFKVFFAKRRFSQAFRKKVVFRKKRCTTSFPTI